MVSKVDFCFHHNNIWFKRRVNDNQGAKSFPICLDESCVPTHTEIGNSLISLCKEKKAVNPNHHKDAQFVTTFDC